MQMQAKAIGTLVLFAELYSRDIMFIYAFAAMPLSLSIWHFEANYLFLKYLLLPIAWLAAALTSLRLKRTTSQLTVW